MFLLMIKGGIRKTNFVVKVINKVRNIVKEDLVNKIEKSRLGCFCHHVLKKGQEYLQPKSIFKEIDVKCRQIY